MSDHEDLEPLDIIDDRTPEQLKADGDDFWPDGTPYVPPKPRQPPVSPVDCKHLHRLFVQSERASGYPGGYRRGSVYVCPDCGEFIVRMQQNSEHVTVTFTLPTPDLVRAAGRYLELLEKEK